MNKALILSLSFSLPLIGMESKFSVNEQLQQKYAAMGECENKYNQEIQQVGTIAKPLHALSYIVAATVSLYRVARYFGFGNGKYATNIDNIATMISNTSYAGICLGYAADQYNNVQKDALSQQKDQNIRHINKEIEDLRVQQILQAIHNNTFQKKA